MMIERNVLYLLFILPEGIQCDIVLRHKRICIIDQSAVLRLPSRKIPVSRCQRFRIKLNSQAFFYIQGNLCLTPGKCSAIGIKDDCPGSIHRILRLCTARSCRIRDQIQQLSLRNLAGILHASFR